jgi:hypothetical protein
LLEISKTRHQHGSDAMPVLELPGKRMVFWVEIEPE